MRILTMFEAPTCSAFGREPKAANEQQWVCAATILCLNELTAKQRERVLDLVREGLTFRHIERLTGHRRETISRYARREGLRIERSRERCQPRIVPASERYMRRATFCRPSEKPEGTLNGDNGSINLLVHGRAAADHDASLSRENYDASGILRRRMRPINIRVASYSGRSVAIKVRR